MEENVTPVELLVDGFQNREVQLVDYKFNQATDLEGQIAGNPRGGRIVVRVKALNDGNNELLQWMLAETDPRNITVRFNNTIDGSVMKEVKGTTCYCVRMTERWEEGVNHYEEVEIVCKELTNGPVGFKNPWK